MLRLARVDLQLPEDLLQFAGAREGVAVGQLARRVDRLAVFVERGGVSVEIIKTETMAGEILQHLLLPGARKSSDV